MCWLGPRHHTPPRQTWNDLTWNDLPSGTLKKCEIGHTHQAPVVPAIPSWDQAVEQTPPMRQNPHLVAECFMGSGAGSPQDYTPIAEDKEKTPLAEDPGEISPTKVEDAPADEQEPAHVTRAEDDVVEIHVGTEDLD